MTDEMLELARENRRKAGVENAEFLKGEIGDRPLPDDHVDVVISNCSINLSHREGVEHLRAGVEDPRSLPGRALRLRRHRLRRGQRSVPVFPGAKNRLH